MTGSVALDLHFTATRKNPPNLHRLAKWTLDALEGSYQSGGKVHPLVYKNDRQVKLLHVYLDQAWGEDAIPPLEAKAGISVTARPLRDAIADLQFAESIRIRDGLFDQAEDWSDETADDDWEDLDTSDPNLDDETRASIAQLNEWSGYLRRRSAQRRVLALGDRAVHRALKSSPAWLSSVGAKDARLSVLGPGGQTSPQDALAEFLGVRPVDEWDFVLSNPFAVPLPGLPQQSGERVKFREEIAESLHKFRARWELLDPLLVPLKAIIVVVPPAQGKDLDNIALDVLPVVHEVLKPHIEPWVRIPRSIESEDLARTLVRLKSINSLSVTSYQVIEIARRQTDPPEGRLRLALGLGESYESPWAAAERSVLGKIMESRAQ